MLDIVHHHHAPFTPQSSSFLDLGGALAAAGLIITVFQLRTSLWALVLRIRKQWQRNLVWYLGAIGLFIMFLRVLLFGTQWVEEEASSLLRNPVYYEIVAYVLFIAAPLSFALFALNKKIFIKN